MTDFKFGDFVIIDGQWRGLVIGARFDGILVATYGGEVGRWNRDRLEYDEAANAERSAATLERETDNNIKRETTFKGAKSGRRFFRAPVYGTSTLSHFRMVKGVNDSEA